MATLTKLYLLWLHLLSCTYYGYTYQAIPTMATLTKLYLLWLYLLGAMLTTTATTAFCLLLNAFSVFPMLIAFGE